MAKAVAELIEAMEEELHGQQKLATVLENKVDAMRHYDVSRLEALETKERQILAGMQRNSVNRKRAVVNLTSELFPGRRGGAVTAGELAKATTDPGRSQILSLSEVLRGVAERVQRLNRINAAASRKLLGHFDHIFQVIAQSGRDIGLYSRAGRKSLLEQNRLIDAIA